MKASDYVAEFLEAQGVTQVFELIGGMITHLIDSLSVKGQIRIVCVHHEQASSFAAEAAGRITGVPGVALATSGPGATNLLTGIGSCYFDSSPTVFITGQVNRDEQKGDRAIRQLGFQETDIVTMAKPITKMAVLVNSPEELPAILTRAFEVALSGRPGPVLVDIPMDVQRADIPGPPPRRILPAAAPAVEPAFIADMLDALSRAERPLILVGGGIRTAQAAEALRTFVDRAGVPVVNSLMGVDVLPWGHPLRVGLLGSYGHRWANLAISRSDLLVVLGSRLDVRQTGARTDEFKNGREIFHVDCEPGEMNNRVKDCHTTVAELRPFLEAAATALQDRAPIDCAAWSEEIAESRRNWPDTAELAGHGGINPNQLMHDISSAPGSEKASAYLADVGQHQMWAAQSLEVGSDQRFLTSGGMGAMGFGLPAAIGVAVVKQDRPVVLVAGDGGFQLNLQELETIARNRLPIKMVILNNNCHGMVRQFQQSYFEERYQSTLNGYTAPDFPEVARAYRIEAGRVENPDDIPAAVEALWRDPTAPYLLEVMIDTFANAYPKLAFGHPISQMEPFAVPIDMEGT